MTSYIELNKQNLLNNYKLISSCLPEGLNIMSVVKGNAYGHGLEQIVSLLNTVSPWFCVSDADELRRLRKISLKPSLILGDVGEGELDDSQIIQTRLSFFRWDQLVVFEKISREFQRPVKVHLACDLLFGRLGFTFEELTDVFALVGAIPYIEVEGIYAHYSCNLETNRHLTKKQSSMFDRLLELAKSYGLTQLLPHIAASSALVYSPRSLDSDSFARPGALLYGIWPESSVLSDHPLFHKITPVLSWYTKISQIKLLPAGYPVGYDGCYLTKQPTKVAVLPIGYADGFPRQLSNKGYVVIKQTRCPIIGRISMNMMTVDVSAVHELNLSDQVTLIGQGVSLHQLASDSGSISYDFMTRISPLISRTIV